MAEPVFRFQKNALEEVHVSLPPFKGKRYVDIRVFYKSTDGSEPGRLRRGSR
jgi:hypothetical protein